MIEQILCSEQWPEQVCRKFAPNDWKDLQQELFLLLMTDLKDKAEAAQQAGYFEFFYIRCASNLTKPRGKVTRYNEGGMDVYALPLAEDEEDEFLPRIEADELEKLAAIDEVKKGLQWYERTLVDMYLSGMSGITIHKKTTIPKNEIYRVIRQFRRQCWEAYK